MMRYSAFGEPQGTAGMPILEVLRHENLTDCVCVVTRYFGGILLGTGGLVRAYTQGAQVPVAAAGVQRMSLYARSLRARTTAGNAPACRTTTARSRRPTTARM